VTAGRRIAGSPEAQPPTVETFVPLGESDMRASIRPTVAEVSLGAVTRNAARIASMVGGSAVWAVVKADAYGHGAVRIAQALEGGRCAGLAVSLVEEGMELRAAGVASPIVVLSAYYDRCHRQVLDEHLTPVVYDPVDLALFSEAAVARGQLAAVHIKVETGMNRLGVAPGRLAEVLQTARKLPGLRIAGLCTHLASADALDPGATTRALAVFSESLAVAAQAGLSGLTNHAANSAAAVRFPAARLQAVRPGLALYGAMSSDGVAVEGLEPALRLSTRIMAVHPIAAGATVSYGGEWRAQRPSLIATLPVGYADGYPRHVRGAQTVLHGKRVPVVGAVCMDMMMVDVTEVSGAAVGDVVTLIGRPTGVPADHGAAAITVDELARWAGTINYEILCGISKRVPRVYRV
jgi:alanine racemase